MQAMRTVVFSMLKCLSHPGKVLPVGIYGVARITEGPAILGGLAQKRARIFAAVFSARIK